MQGIESSGRPIADAPSPDMNATVADLPKITVVMPSFNQARFLREAIDSVFAQRYPSLEFMLLDGGSTDGSAELIAGYSDRLAYARSRPDEGQTAALIEGFSRATGDLVGWINSDDVLFPGALRKIARAYQNAPGSSLIGGNFLFIDAAGRVLRCKRHPRNASWWAKAGLMAVNQPGSFFSRAAYVAAGGLRRDLDYVMDTEFYVRLLSSPDNSYAYVNDWLAGFRLHGENKTSHKRLRDMEHSRALSGYPIGLRRLLNRSAWLWLYRAQQAINGNYARMWVETSLARGKHWRRWSAIEA